VRVQFAPGAMFRVPVGTDDFAYAVMHGRSPYVAFYAKDVALDEDGAPVGEPMFVTLVAKSAYATGGWGKPIRRLPESKLPPLPRFFWQDVTNKSNCKIVEPGVRRTTVSPRDCVGLEPEAIWSGHHIASRIEDTYAGRPNKFAESLQVKL
jgi:hypothetical protein